MVLNVPAMWLCLSGPGPQPPPCLLRYHASDSPRTDARDKLDGTLTLPISRGAFRHYAALRSSELGIAA